MVVNGACKHKDMDHFNRYMAESGMDVTMEYMQDRQLLALQGPGAAAALGRLAPALNMSKMPFMAGQVCGGHVSCVLCLVSCVMCHGNWHL